MTLPSDQASGRNEKARPWFDSSVISPRTDLITLRAAGRRHFKPRY